MSRRLFVPVDTLDYFRHMLKKRAWVDFAVQLQRGMVRAMQDQSGCIHATVEQVADWAGVSHRSAWTAWKHLKALGWASSPRRGVIVFDYRRKPTGDQVGGRPESANLAEILIGVFKPSRKDEPIREVVAQVDAAPAVRSAGDGFDSEELLELEPVELLGQVKVSAAELVDVEIRTEPAAPVPSVAGAAIALLVAAGAERAGAVRAVKVARRENRLDLDVLAKIAAAVAGLPVKPYRPGGLLVDAVKHPALGAKLIREHDQARKGGQVPARAVQDTPKVPGGASMHLSAWEVMRRQVADLVSMADLSEAWDREWFLRVAHERGWDQAALKSIPELREVFA